MVSLHQHYFNLKDENWLQENIIKILGNYLSLKDCSYVSDRIISNTL